MKPINIKENSRRAQLELAGSLLRRLLEPQAYCRQGAEQGLQIFTARNRFAHPVANADAAVRKILLSREWIEELPGAGGKYLISELGRSYLRRLAADDSPYRAQHQVIRRRVERTGDGVEVAINQAETPLGWLLNRQGRDGKTYINRDQFLAGERFREDFTLAQMTPRVTAIWGLSMGGAPSGNRHDSSTVTDAAMAAKARFINAYDAVGPGLSEVLVQVCCHLMGLEQAERHLGWPTRSGKVVLTIALDRLAAHYELGGRRPVRQTGKNNLRNKQNYSCQS